MWPSTISGKFTKHRSARHQAEFLVPYYFHVVGMDGIHCMLLLVQERQAERKRVLEQAKQNDPEVYCTSGFVTFKEQSCRIILNCVTEWAT